MLLCCQSPHCNKSDVKALFLLPGYSLKLLLYYFLAQIQNNKLNIVGVKLSIICCIEFFFKTRQSDLHGL